MADNYLSGKTGFTQVGSIAYSFGKWKFSMNCNLPKVNNFTGGGYQQLVAGLTSGTLTLEGPYNEGNMPLTCGNSYTFNLGFSGLGGTPVQLTCTALVEKLEPDNDVDGSPRINVTAQTTGSFTASIT